MAGVYRRGARWWVTYTDPTRGPERRSLGADVRTEAQARAAARQLERSLDDDAGDPVRRLAGFAPLEEVVEAFLADKAAKREAWTARSYAKHLRSLLRHVSGSRPIGEIGEGALEAFLRARVGEDGIAKGTANKELVTLRVLWAWAIRKRLARENPALLVDPYSVRAVPRTPPTLELVAEALADLRRAGAPAWTRGGKARTRKERPDERHARELYADVLELCSWTGLRVGEVARLEPGDVDGEAATVRIRSARNKGPRLVPLVGPALDVIERRLAQGAGTVFATHGGGPAGAALNLFGTAWHGARPRFALVSPHGVRHLVADRLRAAGVNPIVAARLLGHQTITMHSHYSHEGLDELRAAVTSLGADAGREPAATRSPRVRAPAARSPGAARGRARRTRG